MPFGYHGKILHVDLTRSRLGIEQPGEDFYRQYMGGSALGLYYLLKNTPSSTHPFDPANTLALSLSVLTGVPISGQSRLSAVAKSPLTGAAGDSQSGGFFPAELKFAGFDAIILYGRSERPVYLWVHDGKAELRPAGHLWGKVTGEVQDLVRAELGDEKVEVLQCGPAGENLVRYAALVNMCNRVNGRTGMGAVMGSKNLKAVAVRGNHKPRIADRAALMKLTRWGADHFQESNIYGLGLYGTAETISWQYDSGGLPTRNWSSGTFEDWQSLDGKTMADTILKRRDTCYACSVRCKRVVEVQEKDYTVQPRYGGPEYETIAAFGTYCGIGDLHAVAYANQLCNMYGMDSISCGATIAWAMDCFEQGILTAADLDGVELRFGNAHAMLQLVEKIARREGIGDLLAEGSAQAALEIGHGAQELVVAARNQELPAHMPQTKRTLALIYAVNPFGADHQSHEHDPSYRSFPERMAEIGLVDPQEDQLADDRALNEDKVRYALTTQYFYSCLDSLGMCQFVFGPAWQLYGPNDLAQVVRVVTGWEVTVEELLAVGKRRLNMMRAFNAREGFNRQADRLPKKLEKALMGGKTDGICVDLGEVEKAKDWYYALAGWDISTGVPNWETLEQLGLAWILQRH
jgi:aldehyde:ferredoxin oxidoreductase